MMLPDIITEARCAGVFGLVLELEGRAVSVAINEATLHQPNRLQDAVAAMAQHLKDGHGDRVDLNRSLPTRDVVFDAATRTTEIR